MSTISLLTLLFLRGLYASPTPSPRGDITDAILNTPDGQRSAVDILWSCLTTMIACTWVSAHPNIPPRDGKREFLVIRRLGLILMTMIAPEWVLLYAMREWYGARKLAHELVARGYHWTTTHGYFAQMGGYLLYDGKEKIGILDHWNIHALLVEERTLMLSGREISKEEVPVPEISKEELDDRSKGDGLSKTIAIIQSIWFVIQLIVRWTQNLTVTELELFTLGFAAFNGIIYFMWWEKPLDVRFAVPIYLKKRVLDVGSQTDANIDSNIPKLPIRNEAPYITDDCKADAETHMLPGEGKGDLGYSYAHEEHSQRIGIETLIPAPHWQLEDVLDTAKSLIVMTISHVSKWRRVPLTSQELHQAWREYDLNRTSYLRVPLGDAYIDSYDDFYIHAIASSTFMFFGAVHCIAWNFAFPTVIELRFWRVCAAAITVIPVATNLASWLYLNRRPPTSYKSSPCRHETFPSPLKFLIALPATMTILLYMAARLGLFLDSLLTLRDLTPGALSQVNWTLLLPHI